VAWLPENNGRNPEIVERTEEARQSVPAIVSVVETCRGLNFRVSTRDLTIEELKMWSSRFEGQPFGAKHRVPGAQPFGSGMNLL
jgi:hypothetical protein